MAYFGACLQKSQCVLPIVGIENGKAESLEHADGGGAGKRVVLDDKDRRPRHANSTRSTAASLPQMRHLVENSLVPLPRPQRTPLTGWRTVVRDSDAGTSTSF